MNAAVANLPRRLYSRPRFEAANALPVADVPHGPMFAALDAIYAEMLRIRVTRALEAQ